MDPNVKAFLLSEFIGEMVRVQTSSCRDLQGVEGLILDETKYTFLLHTSKKRKRVPKAGNTFYFPERKVEAKGSLLLYRPEDRTKLLGRRLR
ncbi:ribonuclease P protein subunit [Candidatus Micrarchaeota archaeon]|nr:ribonuclease P protein subunit [Candidatus Micrarchaeota archaeon]